MTGLERGEDEAEAHVSVWLSIFGSGAILSQAAFDVTKGGS
ncbi:hypothetical protein C7412_11513 [Paraburkholderia silvatlantica]|nr:hypothetical protein C7412_11513 [Paraburkholderia silvatlantica]